MPHRFQMILIGTILAVLPTLAQATPVDVNDDGIVGPQELIDLSMSWKGAAQAQLWQANGTSIYYKGGNVGIGTDFPMNALQIGPDFNAAFTFGPSDGTPNAGYIRFGDGTGWQLRIARAREGGGKPLNTGPAGTLVTITDKGNFALGTLPDFAKLGVYDVVTQNEAFLGVRGENEAMSAFTVNGVALKVEGAPTMRNLVEGFKAGNRVFHINLNGSYESGSDFAEALPVNGDKADCEPGDVLVLSDKVPGTVEKSRSPNDPKVAGVYSTRPGVLGADKDGITRVDISDVPVGVVGIVPTKVTVENGPVQPGDLLTTSSTPGCAMKAVPTLIGEVETHRAGTILGKALEPIDQGEGVIKVLITLR